MIDEFAGAGGAGVDDPGQAAALARLRARWAIGDELQPMVAAIDACYEPIIVTRPLTLKEKHYVANWERRRKSYRHMYTHKPIPTREADLRNLSPDRLDSLMYHRTHLATSIPTLAQQLSQFGSALCHGPPRASP